MAIPRDRRKRKSTAFNNLTQNQITEIREAFDILDYDDDKKISENDLRSFSEKFQNLSETEIKNMLEELPEPTYITLLSFFTDKLGMIDDENLLKKDLENLSNYGKLTVHDLSNLLKLSSEDSQLIFKDCSVDGLVDIKKLCVLLKHGELIDNNKTVNEENNEAF